ncbi:MAG TPA: PIG-L family deacetylase [Phycisphaerales bacterium]|nr:PIG-L family deacetylase [Phycisphaerales bacterium]
MGNKILVVAAHPDDEILGCGGTMAKFAQQGDQVYTLILGRGVAARGHDCHEAKKQIEALNACMEAANKAVGAKEVFGFDFPDNSFDTVALLDIVKVVDEIKGKVKPDVVLTHYCNDLNIDHRLTYEAVLTATRPMVGESVREIYSFEVMSSTEWKYPLTFSPDTFFDVSETIKTKLQALEHYKSEMREFPHPRSLDAVELNAKNWGVKTGLKYAEAFKCVRCLK